MAVDFRTLEELRARIQDLEVALKTEQAISKRFAQDAERENANVHDLNARLRTAEGDAKMYKEALQSAEALLKTSRDDLRRIGKEHRELLETYQDEVAIRQELGSALEALQKPTTAAPSQMASKPLMDAVAPGLPERFIEAAEEALSRFGAGYAEYGPGAADELGLAGQWGDLHRKVAKLKRSLWMGENEALTRESEYDILNDIIGHCLLAIEMLQRGFEGGR